MFGVSRLSIFFNSYVLRLVGGIFEFFYYICLLIVFGYFLLLRVPYIFDIGSFLFFLVVFIFPLFVSLMFTRFFFDVRYFLSSFVPLGTPVWIAPFVCLAETISYLVRPFVLIVRPMLNLSIGAFGGVSLGFMTLKFSPVLLLFLLVLFFYEVFVALVHWFIVCNILSFSVDH
nr:ATP synthase F0 subunit 6 [Diplostomoidea sp. MSB para 30071]